MPCSGLLADEGEIGVFEAGAVDRQVGDGFAVLGQQAPDERGGIVTAADMRLSCLSPADRGVGAERAGELIGGAVRRSVSCRSWVVSTIVVP